MNVQAGRHVLAEAVESLAAAEVAVAVTAWPRWTAGLMALAMADMVVVFGSR